MGSMLSEVKDSTTKTDANGFPVVERPVKDERKGKDQDQRKDESKPLPRFG